MPALRLPVVLQREDAQTHTHTQVNSWMHAEICGDLFGSDTAAFRPATVLSSLHQATFSPLHKQMAACLRRLLQKLLSEYFTLFFNHSFKIRESNKCSSVSSGREFISGAALQQCCQTDNYLIFIITVIRMPHFYKLSYFKWCPNFSEMAYFWRDNVFPFLVTQTAFFGSILNESFHTACSTGGQ